MSRPVPGTPWRGCLLALIGLPFLFAFAARPAPQQPAGEWNLTTADFRTRRVDITKFDLSGARVVEADGQAALVPISELVRIERADIAATRDPDTQRPFVLHLRDGDRLLGNPLRLTETALVMATPPFGEVEVPLEQLLALVASDANGDRPWRLPPPAADELVLANGDALRGYVSSIAGEDWTFADEQGNETALQSSAIRQVRFADTGVVALSEREGWRAMLSTGSVVTLDKLELAEGRFSLVFLGREAAGGESDVVWFEPVEGPVRWLSDLPIAHADHTPYLNASFPGVPEEMLEGGRGFVVRSRSRLSFDVPPGFSRFRTRYAMPRDMPLGSADIRILLDDQPVHERVALTAADAPEPIELPLAAARRLTLEVDYGPGLDVQDVVHWIEPALIRTR